MPISFCVIENYGHLSAYTQACPSLTPYHQFEDKIRLTEKVSEDQGTENYILLKLLKLWKLALINPSWILRYQLEQFNENGIHWIMIYLIGTFREPCMRSWCEWIPPKKHMVSDWLLVNACQHWPVILPTPIIAGRHWAVHIIRCPGRSFP